MSSGTPPLGAIVRPDESNLQVGMVADEGRVWLGAVEPEQQFRVTWGDNQQCRFSLPSHLKKYAVDTAVPVRNHHEINAD